MTKTVNIIGAGPGGLAAAMLLGAAGVRVRVFERLPRVGGRCSTLAAPGGYKFDLGPTFFLYPRLLEEIFAATGHNLHHEVELKRLDPQYRLMFGAGGELVCTPDVARMDEQIATLSPSDVGAFRRFVEHNRHKFTNFAPILEQPFSGWGDLFDRRLMKLLPLLKPWRSLGAELAGHFRDERVQLAFTFQSKYLGMSPFQCPSLFSILSFLEYEHGVWHPMGGCGAVSEAMARAAASLGVELHLNEPVEGLEFAGRRVTAVRTTSSTHAAEATVINADFARAMTRLVPDALRRRWSNRKLAKKKFSCSTFMLYLGLDGRCDELSHHTIYLAKNYRENLADIEQRHVLSADPSFYVQNPGVTDHSLAPRGHSSLYVLVPVTHETANVDWSVEREKYRAVALKQLEKVGLRDIEKRIRYEKIVTPADWNGQYEVHRGATFNLAHNLGQMLHLRPHNRFEDLDGVYLVGGGTHPGSGLPVIYSSARITSKLLLEDLGLGHRYPQPPSADRPSAINYECESEPQLEPQLALRALLNTGV